MVRNRTDDDSMTYCFPWKHPMARRRGLEFGVFDQTPPKTASSARPCGPRRLIFFPQQNYHSQCINSALRALPFASFDSFAQKQNPNVGSALQASPFERRKCTRRHFFAVSMSASRSWTCCAWLRPCWVCIVQWSLLPIGASSSMFSMNDSSKITKSRWCRTACPLALVGEFVLLQ